MTMPTPRPAVEADDRDDEDAEPAPVAWGADPPEWDDSDPVDEQPDEFRRY